jgi:hypothetical protein
LRIRNANATYAAVNTSAITTPIANPTQMAPSIVSGGMSPSGSWAWRSRKVCSRRAPIEAKETSSPTMLRAAAARYSQNAMSTSFGRAAAAGCGAPYGGAEPAGG